MKNGDDDHQPPLSLGHLSYLRGELLGKPCVVVYNAAQDETTVIAEQSKWYAQAVAALTILESASVRLPKSLQGRKTVIHAEKRKLILPGSNASN